jgi:uncharacterized membrane protein YjgN (DUF898 family)
VIDDAVPQANAADAAGAAATPPAAVPPPRRVYRMHIEFTGSGSEYFRIWIVNLLLTLVTVGLYYPFAKVRRLRYFYGNTRLGGDEFDFHGNPWKMLRGFLLMALLLGAYALATRASPWAALVALLVMAAIWPALFRASMQFRLANTSWRGLRFHFEGSAADAYRALWPVLVVAVMYLGGIAFITPQEADAADAEPATAAVVITLIGASLAALLTPWFWCRIKRYQHGHYALGPMRTQLRAGAGAFYSVFLKAFGIALLFMLPMFLIGFAAAMAGRKPGAGFAIALPIVAMLSYLGMLVVAGAFMNARLQNLVWSATGNADLRFVSQVRVRALAGLTARNWLLIALTLGLYFPFARIARAKLLLESVAVRSRHPPEALSAALRGMSGDAAGDASADLLGFDVGL